MKNDREGKNNRVQFSIRIDNDVFEMANIFLEKTNNAISRSKLLELGLLEFFRNLEDIIDYDGINLKEIAELNLLRMKRDMVKIFRVETMSKAFFIARVESDIMGIIKTNKAKPQAIPIIQAYIKDRIKEANFYKENKEIIEELKNYEITKMPNDIERVKNYISTKYKENNVIDVINRGGKNVRK